MSSFWAGWVIAFILINYLVILLLFLWAPWLKIPVGEDGTTGHMWANGTIREGLRNLPRWWIIISALSFISFSIYLIRYPGFGNFAGITGWTSTQELHEGIAENNGKSALAQLVMA